MIVRRVRAAGVGRALRKGPHRGKALCGAAAVLVVAGAGGWLALPGGTEGKEGQGDGLVGAVSLPWPDEGQTSIEVQGVGSLGSRGDRRPVPIASVTKVMTAYVILKEHPLAAGEKGPRITVDAAAAQESHSLSESTVQLREGRRHSQRELLELLLLPSGNNVARLLARWDAGSQRAFVAKMNRAAEDLGMTRTTYTGASGFESSTKSTADDQLKLARQAMRQPVLREVVALRSTTVPGVPGTVTNTNRLLEKPGVIGLKTGSSTPAGGNLMWAAEAKSGAGHHLVLGVVLGQRADTTPMEGLEAAIDRSGALIDAVQRRLPGALRADKPVRS
ncbi:D-alanyl-D-alanine carboxypeptidase family protein [Streptomyces flavofungini]|uniref:D-alanyl-D-alanine carboxypeptidase family protein n=1 Tax=Streptomyces flavofungini TaxID=68200 RepID=UPI0019B79098|nr:D-alanyl-D-alanine carboxypeptidase [Streptomyces flavofungini]